MKQLTTQQILQRAKRIKPLVKHENGKVVFDTIYNSASNTNFIEAIDLSKRLKDVDVKSIKSKPNLNHLTTITTYHAYTFIKGFAPTIEEVLSQIPENYIDRTCAFEIFLPSENNTNIAFHPLTGDPKYYASVRLYGCSQENLPNEIKNQPIYYKGEKFLPNDNNNTFNL